MKVRVRWLLICLGAVGGLFLVSGCSSIAGREGDDATKRRADVVLAGLAQVGTPYVYGGETPKEGFDCSGLTFYAHHVVGLNIPRTAKAQRKAAKPVSGDRPRPGDMVFFKTGPGVYHVGLMIDRERFVHASTSRHRVRIARLANPYWRARYLGAGTYLN
ncbi:C40 family peptidase [Thiorhodococcus fuscus]|uniref:C40 family peptidase n=1 Tax=Thiorhodococcus fuscus TaxID=527200 RepID=A0ABW4Y491_9GAMM